MPECPQCGAEYEPRATRCPDCDVALEENVTQHAADDPEAREKTVVAYVTNDETEADVLSQVLEAAGIANFTASEHTNFPMTVSKLGSVRVQVMQHDLDRARRVIAEFQAGGSEEKPEE